MPYSLKQAAAACGRSKSTIYAALKSGQLRHDLDERGRFIIQPEALEEAGFSVRSKNVQNEQEETPLNGEKNGLFLQKIEILERTITALEEDRNEWREQAKAQTVTIEKQAAALAGMSAASARAIAQAEELRHQLAAIEHRKDPEASAPDDTPPPSPLWLGAAPAYWFVLGLLASGAFIWQIWARQP